MQVVLPLVLASYALRTTGGLEQDLVKSTTGLPKLALKVLGASGPADLAHAISEEEGGDV